MRKQRVERINEYAYFVIDEGSFVNTILPYDPLLANLAINTEEYRI